MMLDDYAAEYDAAEATIDAIYKWLVEVVHFPFDCSFADQPAWLDVRKLAELWRDFEDSVGETVEDYEGAIYEETGWPRPE
jgi:hypothetical protein